MSFVLRTSSKPRLPYEWTDRLKAAGLTAGERLVVYYAATRVEHRDGRVVCQWTTLEFAERMGVDRQRSSDAKAKLCSAGMVTASGRAVDMTAMFSAISVEPYLPYSWSEVLVGAGMGPGERVVVYMGATRAFVEDGVWSIRFDLPGLAKLSGCSRNTVRSARDLLVSSGFAHASRSGVYDVTGLLGSVGS